MTSRPNVSLGDAESYFASRLRSDLWNAADEEIKRQALAQASLLISGAFTFFDGAFSTDEQGVTTWDDRVVAAVCEEAVWLLAKDPADVPDALFNGLVSASAGAVSATFDKSFVRPWICEAAKTLIGDLGAFLGDESTGSLRVSQLAM